MGLGGIGQRHLRNLRKLRGDDLEILAYDPRPDPPVLTDQLKVEEGASLDRKYNLQLFRISNRLWHKSLRLAFVCNPTSLHIRQQSGSRAGCALFIEKPLSA